MGTSTLLFVVLAVFSMPLAVFTQIPSDFTTMSMTTEWADTPLHLENAVPFTRPPVNNTMKDGEIDPIIFEPLEQVRLSLSNFQITTVFDLDPFYTDLLCLMDYGCAFGLDLYHTLSDRHDTSPWHGNQELRRHNIDQLLSLIETTLKETTLEVTRLVQTFDLLQAHPNAFQETSGKRADPSWQVRSLRNCTLGLEYSICQGRSPNNAREVLCNCIHCLPVSAAPQMRTECNRPLVAHDPIQRIGGETFPNLDQMAASPDPMSYYTWLVRMKSYPTAKQMAIQLLLHLCSARPEDLPLPFRPCEEHYSIPPEWPIPPSQRHNSQTGQTLPDSNIHWDGRHWVPTYVHARSPSNGRKKRKATPHPHEPNNCILTDTPVSCLHADLAMEIADPSMMAAATRKYQEDCMILVAQRVCNGRNVCGLDTCPAHYRRLTSDEFQVPLSVCTNLKSPRKKRFLGMLLGLFNLAHAKRYTNPTLKLLKKNINTLRENQDQIHGDLAKLYRMVNLSKTELGEHRRLLHKLDENAVTM